MRNVVFKNLILFLPIFLCGCEKQRHTHNVINDPAVDPTCINSGLTEGSHCSECGAIIVEQQVVPAIGHHYHVDEGYFATCLEDGKTSGVHCDVCGEVFVSQNVIEHTGHLIINDPAVDPTCVKNGLTEGSHCSTCGEIIEPQEIIPATGHNYIIDDASDSTCSKEGKTQGMHCDKCGEIFIEQQCVTKKAHIKDHLISIPRDHVESVSDAGLFECSVCHNEYFDTIETSDLDLPVLRINGDLSNISKTNKVYAKVDYDDGTLEFSAHCTLKTQGGSSQSYPKKNYNIQFYKDEELKNKKKVKLVESWGNESKYTLKANYVDYLQMRNVVSAKIYGDIVHSRNIDDKLNSLVNGGAIDGFPIAMLQNGVFHGLYTLNIPKDNWLFGMDGDENDREAILMGNDWTNSVSLFEHMAADFSNGWELEYSSTEDSPEIGNSWVVDSFNNMMDFVNNNTGSNFTDNISTYIDVPRAIDSMLYTWAIHAGDNVSKNMLWVTYDGVKWSPSVYDLDGTWGLVWDGSVAYPTTAWKPYTSNALWNKLWLNYETVIKNRWQELRNGPLSLKNIDKHFYDFYSSVSYLLYESDALKWAGVPSKNENSYTQIINWASQKLKNFDIALGCTIAEENPYSITVSSSPNVQIRFFAKDDYSRKSDLSSSFFSRDGDTGLITSSNGQCNFEIIVSDGYEIENISIEGTYKNFKQPADVGRKNTYRITKIASNIQITVTTK